MFEFFLAYVLFGIIVGIISYESYNDTIRNLLTNVLPRAEGVDIDTVINSALIIVFLLTLVIWPLLAAAYILRTVFKDDRDSF